jgi:aminoglycoside phosphotransferase (APT) family kinase protein
VLAADRYGFLSLATARREAGGPHEIPRLLARGWERLLELVPADVAEAVLAIAERREPFAAELARFPATLVHGDLKLGNVGFLGWRVKLLDWGTQTGWAPPAVEAVWYLAVNHGRIDATREQVLDDVRAAEGERHEEDALRLALLGGLVQLGWDKALHASGHPDPAVRARERADLDWWAARARDALERWSPP